MRSFAGGGAPLADGTAPDVRRGHRRMAWLIAITVLAALTALGLTKLDPAQVGRAFTHVNGDWIALGATLMVGAFLARGESWFTAIRAALPDRPIDRLTVTRALMIGMAGSTVAPGRLGEAARAWLIARRAGAARETLATVVGTLLSQSLLNLLALVILGVVALGGSTIPGARTGALVLAVTLPVGVVILLILGPRLPGAGWVRRQVREIRHGLTVFRSPRTAAHSVCFQLAAWAMQWGTCYTVLVAFGLERRATPATAAGILLAVNLTALLPLTPSNVGVFQAACIAVLAPVGIRAGTGLAYGLVLQAIEIAGALALGLPSLMLEGLSPGRLRRAQL